MLGEHLDDGGKVPTMHFIIGVGSNRLLPDPPEIRRVPDLVVITGPIASGKSSVANALGERLREAGRSIAVVGFDDLVDTVGGFAGITAERLRQAFRIYAQLISAWLSAGFDVIADGPALSETELGLLLGEVSVHSTVRRVMLSCTYGEALERVTTDPTRQISRDPDVLRHAYSRFEASLSPEVSPDWAFDTTRSSIDEVVGELASGFSDLQEPRD
jgi:chloramphenicol 3-O-phosphotransferase